MGLFSLLIFVPFLIFILYFSHISVNISNVLFCQRYFCIHINIMYFSDVFSKSSNDLLNSITL